jgi:hypothetical protein
MMRSTGTAAPGQGASARPVAGWTIVAPGNGTVSHDASPRSAASSPSAEASDARPRRRRRQNDVARCWRAVLLRSRPGCACALRRRDRLCLLRVPSIPPRARRARVAWLGAVRLGRGSSRSPARRSSASPSRRSCSSSSRRGFVVRAACSWGRTAAPCPSQPAPSESAAGVSPTALRHHSGSTPRGGRPTILEHFIIKGSP